MRHIFLFLLCVIYGATFVATAGDPESNRIRIYTNEGDSIDGYMRHNLKTGLKNLFSKTGSIHKYINFGLEAKGGETKGYSADDIKAYRFLEASEGYPEGALYVSTMINAPRMFKSNNKMRGFAFVLNSRPSGEILQWSVFESTGGRNSQQRLVPAIGVKFKGDDAAYPFMINGRYQPYYLSHHLKKKAPELHKFIEAYLDKGDDKNAHRKELVDNPSILLTLYEQYLAQGNPPLNLDNEK